MKGYAGSMTVALDDNEKAKYRTRVDRIQVDVPADGLCLLRAVVDQHDSMGQPYPGGLNGLLHGVELEMRAAERRSSIFGSPAALEAAIRDLRCGRWNTVGGDVVANLIGVAARRPVAIYRVPPGHAVRAFSLPSSVARPSPDGAPGPVGASLGPEPIHVAYTGSHYTSLRPVAKGIGRLGGGLLPASAVTLDSPSHVVHPGDGRGGGGSTGLLLVVATVVCVLLLQGGRGKAPAPLQPGVRRRPGNLGEQLWGAATRMLTPAGLGR